MPPVQLRADLAPVPAMQRARALIQQAGFPRHEHVQEAVIVLSDAIRQAGIVERARLREMGIGRFCGCCGQRKPDAEGER